MQIFRPLSLALLAALSAPAGAQTWFSGVPYTITNSTSVDTNATVEVNGNFAGLVSQGNTGETTLLGLIAGIGPIGMPSGAVVIWLGSSCPTGYQNADGTNSTADARGVYIRGLDTGGSIDPGRTLASYQADQFQTHLHNAPTVAQSLSLAAGGSGGGGSQLINSSTTTTPNTSGESSGGSGTPGAVETRPLTIVTLMCEKL